MLPVNELHTPTRRVYVFQCGLHILFLALSYFLFGFPFGSPLALFYFLFGFLFGSPLALSYFLFGFPSGSTVGVLLSFTFLSGTNASYVFGCCCARVSPKGFLEISTLFTNNPVHALVNQLLTAMPFHFSASHLSLTHCCQD